MKNTGRIFHPAFLTMGVIACVSAGAWCSYDWDVTGDGASGAVTLDPENLSFGNVLLNEEAERSVALVNDTEAAITSLSGAGLEPPFSFKGGTFPGTGGTCSDGGSLEARSECTIIVSYAPTSEGEHDDEIVVSYDDGAFREIRGTLQGAGVQPSDEIWQSYVDTGWYEGDLNTNIRRYSTDEGGLASALDGSSGPLVRYSDGSETEVIISISGGTFCDENCDTGADVSTGDGFDVFGGIVSTFGMISYSTIPPTGPIVVELSNMNPDRLYEVVFYSNRNEPSYTDRYTTYTISDHESFTNESSSGSSFSGPTDESTEICTGYNAEEHVARFNNVDPGTDGDVTFTLTGTGDDPDKPYLSAIYIRQFY